MTSEVTQAFETGPYIWRRFGVSFGRSDWRQGYTNAMRYRGMVRQRTFKIGPVHVYSIVLLRGEYPRGESG